MYCPCRHVSHSVGLSCGFKKLIHDNEKDCIVKCVVYLFEVYSLDNNAHLVCKPKVTFWRIPIR
jgi:hypothetical protein